MAERRRDDGLDRHLALDDVVRADYDPRRLDVNHLEGPERALQVVRTQRDDVNAAFDFGKVDLLVEMLLRDASEQGLGALETDGDFLDQAVRNHEVLGNTVIVDENVKLGLDAVADADDIPHACCRNDGDEQRGKMRRGQESAEVFRERH